MNFFFQKSSLDIIKSDQKGICKFYKYKFDLQYKLSIKNIKMYFRRYTRMHLYPAIKYFSKYGLLDKGYQRFMPLFNIENPPSDHMIKRKLSKPQLREKDLDTKLIERLFLKYPDLKYEPISSQKFAGRKFNTFSYAFSFISEQKKLINEGYTVEKAFQIVQQKYQDQMQRKLDQTLLSRGLAIGNRARSFLNFYQQQVEYQSRLKVQRTKRQLQKYEQKLNKLRSRIESDEEAKQQEEEFNDYERIFQKIVKQQNINKQTKESGKIPIQQRNQMINKIEKDFKNVFNQFYQRASYKDKLEGLTDQEIINNIHASPNKIKRQNKLLIQYLKKKGSVSIDHVGQIRISESQNPKLRQFLLTSPEVKIALLTEKLNYEKPSEKNKSKQGLMGRRSVILKNRPQMLTNDQKDLIKYNKKLDMELASESDFPSNKQVYKIFQSAQERLLRLELKYLNMMCQKQIEQLDKKRAQSDPQGASKHRKRYEQAEVSLNQTIQKFRRVKYRLENKFKKATSEQLLFNEHKKLGDDLTGGDAEYEQLLLYLRKKSEERRLTSISQSNDNKIHSYLDKQELPQYPLTQGEVRNNKN